MYGKHSEPSLKIYPVSKGEDSAWVVSGPSKNQGKRWRKTFKTRNLAEEFFNREVEKCNSGGGASVQIPKDEFHPETPEHIAGKTSAIEIDEQIGQESEDPSDRRARTHRSKGLADHGRSLRGVTIVAMVASVAILADGIDRKVAPKKTAESEAVAIRSDFESNPLLSGWIPSIAGAEWTNTEHVSGKSAIVLRGGDWRSRSIEGRSGQWYRLAFRSKGATGNPSKNVVSGCSIVFSDRSGKAAEPGIKFPVQLGKRWHLNEFWFRTQPFIDLEGNLGADDFRIRFSANENEAFFVDEVVLEKAAARDVEEWADGFYATFPSALQYKPADNRWERIPGTMSKLRGHQKVRIIIVGDDVSHDLANAPIELFIERNYPGCRVEVIPSIVVEGGVKVVSENMGAYILDYKPDLVIFGGELYSGNGAAFEKIVHEVRETDARSRRKTEMLILTSGWRSNVVQEDDERFSSDMRELNQDVAKNPVVPNNPRGQILRFAAANGIEFLDLRGIISEFIFGAASAANAGPATTADGVPYGFWTRDWIHPAEIGKHVMGRILEAYFAPTGIGGQKSGNSDRTTKRIEEEVHAHDRELLVEARREFQVSALERPAFLRNFRKQTPGKSTEDLGRKGLLFRLGNDQRKESGFNFDEPADLRRGDVAVYWSFSSDRSLGEEKGKLGMRLCFTEPGRGGRHDRAQVSLTVRPGGVSLLGVDGELLDEQGLEFPVEVPVENFVEATREAKFRLVLRWTGGDRVVAEASSWSPRTKRWEGFTPHDRPGAPPLVMELSISKNLLGNATFKSIFFESFSDVPKLGMVLVTVRPSLVR